MGMFLFGIFIGFIITMIGIANHLEAYKLEYDYQYLQKLKELEKVNSQYQDAIMLNVNKKDMEIVKNYVNKINNISGD